MVKSMENGIKVSEKDFFDPVLFQIAYLNQKPHKKQAEVLRSKHKHKIIVCGRRSGKSQMIAGELIRGAVLKIYPTQILIAPTYKQTLIVFDKIIELVERAKVYDDIEKVVHSPYPKIIWKNGSFIDFGSADNPNSIRGVAYDRVFKDESAFIKRGADNAIKPLTYDKGAPTWETTTPWGKGDVWDKWVRGQNGDEDYGCFHYNYKDNPYLSEEGIREIEKDIREFGENSLYVQAEIYGNFVSDRDCYFERELVEKCIDNTIPIGSVHPDSTYILGVDVAGMGQDESVFIVLEITNKDEVRVNFIDYYEKNRPREIVGKVKVLDEKYNFEKVYIDKTGQGEGPEDWLKETLSEERVEGIRFTVQTKEDIYSNLKKLMNQKLKFPDHKKLVFQLLDLRYEIGSSGNLKIHHPEGRYDDYPDALALACWYLKGSREEVYTPFIDGF